MRRDRPLSRRAGFTLVEIMVVVVILGILATLATTNVFTYIFKGKKGKAQSDITSICNAVDTYAMEKGLPAESDISKLWEGEEKLLKAQPIDPWDEPYVYRKKGPREYVVFSKGEDKLADTDDDISSEKKSP